MAAPDPIPHASLSPSSSATARAKTGPRRASGFALWALGCWIFALAILPAPAEARVVLCCQDERGRRVCGDTLPRACIGRAYEEIGSRGVIRRHPAPISAEERARNEEAERLKEEEDARRIAERRRDQALLESYGSSADIAARREREIAEVERAIVASQEDLAALTQRRERFARESEFYAKDDLPGELQRTAEELDREEASIQRVIETRREEQEKIRARYAADIERFEALRNQLP